MRTLFARIGHTLLLLMMMSGLALPLQVHAQYEMEGFGEDQELMNSDVDTSDSGISVIVIPDSTPAPGGCGGGCRAPVTLSSTAQASSAGQSSASSRKRILRPLKPAAPAAQVIAPIAPTVSPEILAKRKVQVLQMQQRTLQRRKERITHWQPKQTIIQNVIQRVPAPTSLFGENAWRWHGLPMLLGDISIAVPLIGFWRAHRLKRKKRMKKNRDKPEKHCCDILIGSRKISIYFTDILGILLIACLILAGLVQMTPRAHAEATTPARRVFSSKLTNSSGTPITSEQKLRFSYWRGGNAVPSDLNGDGTINVGAANYAGWQEEHTVTPSVTGNFTVELGKFSGGLPVHQMTAETLRNLYLQVEVKSSGAADTSYFLVDPFPQDATRDRVFVSTNIFALNADMLDQRDLGTGSGSIPYLLSGGVLPVSTMAAATNADFYTIDNNNNAVGSVGLQFGGALNKTLIYNKTDMRFEFNDNVHIQGNLSVSGTINGVDITNLTGAESALRASSGGGLNLNISGGNYRINGAQTDYAGGTIALPNNATVNVFFGSGGLTARIMGFPADESYIPVAQVTTAGGTITAIDDKRVLQSDDRETEVKKVMQPGFPGVTFQADASDNVGTLEATYDSMNNKGFYKWSSTRATLQDYDVLLQPTLSRGFVRWKTGSLKIHYRTTSANAADNKLDITVFDTNGSPVTLAGTSTDLASTSWAITTLNFSGNPTWTPGQPFLVKIKVHAKDNFQAHVGAIELLYNDLLSP